MEAPFYDELSAELPGANGHIDQQELQDTIIYVSKPTSETEERQDEKEPDSKAARFSDNPRMNGRTLSKNFGQSRDVTTCLAKVKSSRENPSESDKQTGRESRTDVWMKTQTSIIASIPI